MKKTLSERLGLKDSAKRGTLDELFFTWLGNKAMEETLLTLSQELTRKMVQNQTIDLKATKRQVLNAKHVPQFPDTAPSVT